MSRSFSLRNLFIDVLLRQAAREQLRVSEDCLNVFTRHVDGVVAGSASQLLDSKNLEQARAELKVFVDRMIDDARARGSDELDSHNFRAARARCGLVWWCKP